MNNVLFDYLLQQLDPALTYEEHETDGDILRIRVSSTRKEVCCPNCGKPSVRQHSKYQRTFRDLPVMGMKTEIELENRLMVCTNPDCEKKRFAETFDRLESYSRKSNRLWEKIIDVALDTSSTAASAILKDGIADVSKSTICEHQRREPPEPDMTQFSAAGIDDWAIRKRETYGTVIVDLQTHCIIDLIASRGREDVAQYLKQYTNVKIVCRDGSKAYRAAITEAAPKAVQVSDYFHLLKGLTEAAKTSLKQEMDTVVSLEPDDELSERWRASDRETSAEKRVRQTTEQRKRLLGQIQELKKQGLGRRRIAKELGIAEKTAQNFLAPDFDPADKRIGTRKRVSKVAPYADDIFELYDKGLKVTEILRIIREKGYTGYYNTVHAYISREKKRRTRAHAAGSRVVDRSKAIAMLYRPDKNFLTKQDAGKLTGLYPVYGHLRTLVAEFKNLFAEGEPGKLDEWLEKASALDLVSLNSFVNGIRTDIDAVRAAVLLGLTSGVVEGSVTKIKVTKRIMYGHSSFELLRSKILHREARKVQRQKNTRCA